MDTLSSSCSTRNLHLHLLVMGLLFLVNETHAVCPDPCSCKPSNTVRCGYNNLAAIPLGLPDDTRVLYLEYNDITKLAAGEFSGLTKLEKMYLYNNRISEIEDGAFRDLTSLKILHLASNDINWVTNHTFEGVPVLEELHLRNNRLSSLPSSVFSQVPQLVELDLAENDFGEFPADVSQDLSNVEKLDLSHNKADLMTNSVLGHMLALVTLKLNFLRRTADGSPPALMPDSAFEGLINLQELELDENNLNRIPLAVRSLRNLTSLSVSLNSIQTVRASNFYQPSLLQFLSLERNALVGIPTSALAQLSFLTDLILDYNPISNIPALAFMYNPHLATLSLAYTNLTTIDKDAFVGPDQLNFLYLQGNNLTTIIDGAMDAVNPGAHLRFSPNPFHCDCHLREFGAWLKDNHTGTLDGQPPQCLTPGRLMGRSVLEVQSGQFACRPREIANTETEISAMSGTDVHLPCAIQADPRLIVYWITSGHDIIYLDQPQPPYSFNIMPNGSVWLLITTVHKTNEGMYTCVVSNDAGEARSSVTLQVVSDSTVTPTINPDTASKTPTINPDTASKTPTINPDTASKTPSPRGNTESRVDGLVFGIAGGIFVIVVLIAIVAVLAVRRRSSKPRPLPALPTPQRETQFCSNDETYDVIPADLDPTCDEKGYSNRIKDSVSPHPPSQIDHTYFSRIKSDQGTSECEPDDKSGSLVVNLPDNRYSALPTESTNGQYMMMKPQIT